MALKRISDQKSLAIEAFYLKFYARSDRPDELPMLSFIKMFNELFGEPTIWCLTSMGRLVLLNQDEWKSDWFVIIHGFSENEFSFEYLMPKAQSPWNHATVKGEADSLEEAKKYLLISMKESGGWDDNEAVKSIIKLNLEH